MDTQAALPSPDFCAQVITQEANALLALAAQPDLMRKVRDAAALVVESGDPLIISGVGKSGHIARKIASTFCSLGKPAAFLHAAEASHGDLGLVGERSVVVVLSNSGETSELSDLLAYCQVHQHDIIAITANPNSTLGRAARIALAYGKPEEACRNGLAPTTSTTIALALGDALAVTASEIRQMAPEDFRRYHPGGKLGARLARVADRMRPTGEAMPFVAANTSMADVVITMSSKGLGVALVQDAGDVVAIITDGDMRRHAHELFQVQAGDIATANPYAVRPDAPISEAADRMAEKGITACLVRDADGTFLGLLHIHDCLRTA
jgi:arabinose-5-phosphate isomerase